MTRRAASLALVALICGCAPAPEIIAGPLVDTERWAPPARPGRGIEPAAKARALDPLRGIDAIDAELRDLRDTVNRQR